MVNVGLIAGPFSNILTIFSQTNDGPFVWPRRVVGPTKREMFIVIKNAMHRERLGICNGIP